MHKLLAILLGSTLLLSQSVMAADASCRELSDTRVATFLSFYDSADEGSLLRIDFDNGEICVAQTSELNLETDARAKVHFNEDLNELAIQATVEGYETWIRIDGSFDGELILDRATAEALDLTVAEFLGDNSQLEASNFFIEYVGALEIGSLRLRNIETNIPLLESPYDHYTERGQIPAASEPEFEFLTVGSIGESLLEDLIIMLDIANNYAYVTEAE